MVDPLAYKKNVHYKSIYYTCYMQYVKGVKKNQLLYNFSLTGLIII